MVEHSQSFLLSDSNIKKELQKKHEDGQNIK